MKYLFIAFTTVALLISCTPKVAEIIEETETTEEVVTSTDGDMPNADIGAGKVIFLNDCVTCHSYTSGPLGIAGLGNFTKTQVDAVLPKMIENAKLNETQSRQVTSYLYWELEK